ncbi:MAG: tRNA (N6-threonylcarbamoyladenosine(37)-N6)-methyltransferase TrmO [Oscillospiraceae bacterium]|nr:tRNA (N6-threonylcarbamoyladenosine(37)-N6)-methyltransferase TrmO [Oscillospiraceae bacterium]
MSGGAQELRAIARIGTDFPEKFGIPRQAGVVEELEGRIVFEPEFRNPDALRGIEGFSHLWLIWQFSESVREGWSPTVRPPRLGGNVRMGVFATRSPFRPNPLGLSCVRLLGVEQDPVLGPVLRVAGADLMDGTPIYDIKPYIPYADCRPEALSGFAPDAGARLRVVFEPGTEEAVPEEKRAALRGVLENDPRPRYQDDPTRVYGLAFAGLNVRFRVENGTLTVEDVEKRER